MEIENAIDLDASPQPIVQIENLLEGNNSVLKALNDLPKIQRQPVETLEARQEREYFNEMLSIMKDVAQNDYKNLVNNSFLTEKVR